MSPLNSIVEETAEYEAWLGGLIPLWQDDLDRKHQAMAAEPFAFFRATFYRWSQRFPRLCGSEADAPPILAVGDLHVENFGTWRDSEGRLVWGLNDFDEVATIPYTNDLLRLATSARLALKAGRIDLTTSQACAAVLEGYVDGLRQGGQPMILAEDDRWLRQIATTKLRDPVTFWAAMTRLPALNVPLRSSLRRRLVRELPRSMKDFRLQRRRAGLGSLGRERVVALGKWQGAYLAREVKASAPSAWGWAHALKPEVGAADKLARGAVRCPDPFFRLRPDAVVRRLAPDCSRVVLADMTGQRDDYRLLRAMGWETANIHLANAGVVELVHKDLGDRPGDWLEDATRRMARGVMRDWKHWRTAYRKPAKRDRHAGPAETS
ncbi:MAG: DUF2252 family protein [Candidatus Dormibacteria bacterium]